MEVKTAKTTEVIFDVCDVLLLVKQHEELMTVLQQKTDQDYKLLYTMAKGGLMSDDLKDYLRGIFQKIVLKQNHLLKEYVKLQTLKKDVKMGKSETPETVTLPKHYGKKKIEEDIKKQGGNATEVQKAMLALNEMRNIYGKLLARGISDMVVDTNKLTEEDCRNIVSMVERLGSQFKKVK